MTTPLSRRLTVASEAVFEYVMAHAAGAFYCAEISRATNVPKQTVSRTLHRLQRAGLLTSELEPANTPGGRQRRLMFRFVVGGAVRARHYVVCREPGPPPVLLVKNAGPPAVGRSSAPNDGYFGASQ